MRIRFLAATVAVAAALAVSACASSSSSSSPPPIANTATTNILAQMGYFPVAPAFLANKTQGVLYTTCPGRDLTACGSGTNWLRQATPTHPAIVVEGGEVAILIAPAAHTLLYDVQVLVPSTYQNLAKLTADQRQALLGDATQAAHEWSGALGATHQLYLPYIGPATVVTARTVST